MTNSDKYWDDLFSDNEQNKKRAEQTRFFVELAINNMPQWVNEDIRDNALSICDAGCAEGVGTKILQEQFDTSAVMGVDFSENAVNAAKSNYCECEFAVENVKNMERQFDVVFSSNVLEHFSESEKVMNHLIHCSKAYCIFLLPFREYYTCPEHVTYFDFQSFPLDIEDEYSLCYFKPITILGENEKYWFGEQILVIYVNKKYLSGKTLTLRNMYNGYVEDRTRIIAEYDKHIQEIQNKYTEEKEELYAKTEKALRDVNNLKEELSEANKNNAVLRQMSEKLEKTKIEMESLLQSSRKTINELNEKNQILQNNKGEVLQALENIKTTQNSRAYKCGLIARRFGAQFVKGKEKKDFIKWGLGKVTGKDYHTRYLCEFDYLENAKRCLNSQRKDIEENEVTEDIFTGSKKETRSVIIFASVPFYDVGGGQRSAQMAKTFNNLGYKVHYIYGFECNEENIPDMFIPTNTHKMIDQVTEQWFKNVITPDTLVIFEIPYIKFQPYFEMAKKFGCYTVYEHIDNWDSSLGCLFYDEAVFKMFVEEADLITVTAKLLGEKILEISSRDYLYLPNAVNTELFEPSKTYDCPKDLTVAKNGGKTLLYFGSLWGEWFDWEKIEYLSEKCKDCEINLIGDYSGIKERASSMAENVHFLGLKKQSELPAYLTYSDIAILPFKNCEIGKYVSPLKIFEYIAMNKKVVSTALDDIQNYPNVYCSDDKDEWVKLVCQDDENIDASSFIADNNWFARCGELIKRAGEANFERSNISVVVLNYNNKKVIERCVNTLLGHNSRYNYEIIVIDNGSKDGSYEELKAKYEGKIVLLQNDRNGCSSGRNLGVKHAKGDYICFLDSDQWIVSDYWLDSAIQILQKKNMIGAVSWNAGWFSPGTTTGPIVDYLPNRGLSSAAIWFRTDIAYLATSGMLMRKQLFEEIEGFDTYYDPTCYEDTDISLKIRDYGFEIAYCPYMSIMHLPHQTTKSGSPQHTELMNRNGTYFYEKWKKKNPKLLEYYL